MVILISLLQVPVLRKNALLSITIIGSCLIEYYDLSVSDLLLAVKFEIFARVFDFLSIELQIISHLVKAKY